MIDNQAIGRSQDPELLALGELMERVLRWIGRQGDGSLQRLMREVEDDLEDIEHREVGEEHRRIAQAALARQRELISVARVQQFEPRLRRD